MIPPFSYFREGTEVVYRAPLPGHCGGVLATRRSPDGPLTATYDPLSEGKEESERTFRAGDRIAPLSEYVMGAFTVYTAPLLCPCIDRLDLCVDRHPHGPPMRGGVVGGGAPSPKRRRWHCRVDRGGKAHRDFRRGATRHGGRPHAVVGRPPPVVPVASVGVDRRRVGDSRTRARCRHLPHSYGRALRCHAQSRPR